MKADPLLASLARMTTLASLARMTTLATITIAFTAAVAPLHAQDRLKSLPGYDRYSSMAPQIFSAALGAQSLGRGGIAWSPDSKSVEFMQAGKRMRYDVATKKVAEAPPMAT